MDGMKPPFWINRYHNKPAFRNLVETLTAYVIGGKLDEREIQAAAKIVSQRVEEFRQSHPDWDPVPFEQRDEEQAQILKEMMIRPPFSQEEVNRMLGQIQGTSG